MCEGRGKRLGRSKHDAFGILVWLNIASRLCNIAVYMKDTHLFQIFQEVTRCLNPPLLISNSEWLTNYGKDAN